MPPVSSSTPHYISDGATTTTTTVNNDANASTSQHLKGEPMSELAFDDIPSCIAAFQRGEFLIVLDAATRENEGDLIIAAQHLTPEKCAFMIRHTSGYLCAPLSLARAKLLDLPAMIATTENEDPNRTAYAITVDAVSDRYGAVTTGISAHDRAATCRVLADARTEKGDLRRPGHVVPLLVRDGGVMNRRGHTEAGWEFARLAGIQPEVAVIGEMVIDGVEEGASRGTGEKKAEYHGAGMMRADECLAFGKLWGIKCCTIESLVQYVENGER